MKVKKSEIQLLIAVLGVLLVVVTYFLVYAKFNELSDAMESQNMSLRSQVSTLECWSSVRQIIWLLPRR